MFQQQTKEDQLMDIVKKLYFIGAVVFTVLFLMTIFWGGLVSPLRLLQIRLLIVGTALIYYLGFYYYNHRTLKSEQQQETIYERPGEVVIFFNGKELGR